MTNNHLSPRTIREWLELIPFDRARREAIENYENDAFRSTEIAFKLSRAIWRAFDFEDTLKEQGVDYWRSIYNCIHRMEQSVKLKQ